MSDVRVTRRGALGLAAAAAIEVALAPGRAAAATARPTGGGGVVEWINANAVPLPRVDAGGPVDHLAPLHGIVGDARVVGIGESAHGTHEMLTLKHRAARFLVEELGFRTIAWEDSWGAGVPVDRYVTGGSGDAARVVSGLGFQLRTRAMLDLVAWMRAFNQGRADDDKVRFLGSDVTEVHALPFRELIRHVTDVAPGRLGELHRDLDPIGYRGSPEAHFGWYFQQPPAAQARFVRHARAVLELVESLPEGGSSIDREDALQHARSILGFYDAYAEQLGRGTVDVRDRYIADTITWWQDRTGHRMMYGAANVHTAASPRLVYTFPPDPDPIQAVMAGGHLRRHYGQGYVSVATAFHTGRILAGWEQGAPSVFTVPPAGPRLVDHTLGKAGHSGYLLDLHADAPEQVDRWLDAPARLRLIGAAYDARIDELYSMRVGSLRGAFDAVFHLPRVSPARLLR